MLEAGEVIQLGLSQHLLVIDGGRAPGGVPSTIVRTASERPEILREGAIPAWAILAAFAEIEPGPGNRERARYDQRMKEDERNDLSEATP
jgi:hypothetical protein